MCIVIEEPELTLVDFDNIHVLNISINIVSG